jgi:hypothetical protein
MVVTMYKLAGIVLANVNWGGDSSFLGSAVMKQQPDVEVGQFVFEILLNGYAWFR